MIGMRWWFRRWSAGRSHWMNIWNVRFFTGHGRSRETTLSDTCFRFRNPEADVLEFARQLSNSGKYLMATINNESTELNLYRINKFGLREIFTLFVSSCFVGLRKPEEGIYRLALDITQKSPQECCFIDDRALNLECARGLGMNTIEMENLGQLREALGKLGVEG